MGPADAGSLIEGAEMNLGELLQVVDPLQVAGNTETQVKALTCDSRKVRPGTIFFALPGNTVDGHAYITAAVEAGASVLVLEDTNFAPAAMVSLISKY